MKFLFINSMSRTGTSLLYQLLYGHGDIYFAPFRIQFVCADPFGFPLCSDYQKEEFYKILMQKTTIVYKADSWPNIHIDTLANLFPNKHYEQYYIQGNNTLESAIRTIHNVMEVEFPRDVKYYCLHDDHSYIMGSRAFLQYYGAKVLTTIRNPFDMIASKKNMLTMYVYGKENPQNFTLKKEVIYKEIIRAYFSWWVASDEYSRENLFPLFYTHLKSKDIREEAMRIVANFLELDFDNKWLDEHNVLEKGKYHNELLANGSSISTVEYLTGGKVTQEEVKSTGKFSLNTKENEILNDLVDYTIFDKYLDFKYFIREFDKFYLNSYLQDDVILGKWKAMYKESNFEVLFREYSNMNYGRTNSNDAFE